MDTDWDTSHTMMTVIIRQHSHTYIVAVFFSFSFFYCFLLLLVFIDRIPRGSCFIVPDWFVYDPCGFIHRKMNEEKRQKHDCEILIIDASPCLVFFDSLRDVTVTYDTLFLVPYWHTLPVLVSCIAPRPHVGWWWRNEISFPLEWGNTYKNHGYHESGRSCMGTTQHNNAFVQDYHYINENQNKIQDTRQ